MCMAFFLSFCSILVLILFFQANIHYSHFFYDAKLCNSSGLNNKSSALSFSLRVWSRKSGHVDHLDLIFMASLPRKQTICQISCSLSIWVASSCPDTCIFSPSNALSMRMMMFYSDAPWPGRHVFGSSCFETCKFVSSPPHLVSLLSGPRQATGLPYSEITWPSANPAPRPSRCAPPLTALPHQRSLDLPSEIPPPCPAHPEGRHPLRRVKSTMVWRPPDQSQGGGAATWESRAGSRHPAREQHQEADARLSNPSAPSHPPQSVLLGLRRGLSFRL